MPVGMRHPLQITVTKGMMASPGMSLVAVAPMADITNPTRCGSGAR